MAEPRLTSPMFEQLLALNQGAFHAGHDNTASHLLAAARHEGEGDPHHCLTVQHLAEAQLAEIEAAHPVYEHSTASAAARGRASSDSRRTPSRPLAPRRSPRQNNPRTPAGPMRGDPNVGIIARGG